MNKIIKRFLLTGEKFMPELHLKQQGFTYNACGPFTKHREIIRNLEKQVIQNIYTETNQIYSATCSDSKDLTKRTISYKTLNNKGYEIARNCKYNGYQRALASIMQEWLHNNNVLLYSTYNEDKSVIAERFIKTLKAETHKK